MRSALWAVDRALKKFLENVPPTPAWRWIASLKVSDSPSCISSGRARTPQSGGVRTMFLVAAPVLDDPVASPDVVQQEVTERADYLAAEGRRDDELATVNNCPRRDGVKL